MALLKLSAAKPISIQTALFALCLGASLVASSTAFAAPRTLFVDDDLMDRPNAPFQRIQDAIRSANDGDTIRVSPGTYSGDNGGPIVVDKAVTIQGNSADTTIVLNNGLGGFDVTAGTVNINHFKIVGSNSAPSYPNAGIYLRSGTGRTLNFNTFENNGLGIYVEGTETSLEVNNNQFDNNYRTGDNYPSGGLFAPGGPVSTATIRKNSFSTDGSFCINIGGGSTGGLVINNNTADNEGAFVVIGGTTNAQITGNTATNLYSTGIYSFGANSGLLISGNMLQGAGVTLGNGAGIRLTTGYGNTVGDSTPTINTNNFSGFPFDGIGLNNVTGAVVRDNNLSGNGRHGLWLQNVSGSRFLSNTISNNAVTGIRVESVSTNNVIGNAANGNTLSGNTLDAADASTGTKTAKTANTWKGNTGATSSPDKLLNN